MKRPRNLDGLELEDVLSEIQKTLYLDDNWQGNSPDPRSTGIWRPGKKVDGETLLRIDEIMHRYGLAPTRDEPIEDE